MAKKWSKSAKTAFRWGRQALPVIISIGLIVWLIWSVTPNKLAQAFSSSHWPYLLGVAVIQLVVLFFWDIFSMWWLFSQPRKRVPFRKVFRARADSALWTSVNLEIGQAVFAYDLAKIQNQSVANALGRCFVLGLFDFGSLQTLGLIGSFIKPEPSLWYLRWICVGAVSGLSIFAGILYFLPRAWREWLSHKRWASWLAWWTWRHSILLAMQRLTLFLLVFAYVGVCMAIMHLPVSLRIVFGIVPFVLIAESLPGTGGMGERETALVYLLGGGGHRAELLAFGLIWSVVNLLGRLFIGIASRLLPRKRDETYPEDREMEAESSSEARQNSAA